MPHRPFVMPLAGVSFETAVSELVNDPAFVAVDSRRGPNERFSVVAANPASIISQTGAFVTIDGHTSIDSPKQALLRFLKCVENFSADPYLPFSGGAIGYIGFEGARALGGFEPAKGFSRFPQCRFGIYKTAVIFDRAEGTSFVVANGESENRARANAEILAERLALAPAWRPFCTGDAKTTATDWRIEPDDASFEDTLKEARLWLGAEITKRIHVVRRFTKSMPEMNAAQLFFTHEKKSSVRAMFTHEGAFAIASSQARIIDSRRLAYAPPLENVIECILKTPVCGEPFGRAVSFIGEKEDFHRTLYGGSFGFIDSSRSEFHAINSAITAADGAMTVTAGTDVTRDSNLSEIPRQINITAQIHNF